MPWTRLDPAGLIPQLRFVHDPASPDDKALAEKATAHLRNVLLTGDYIAVQNEEGRTFIGTQDEAVEHIIGWKTVDAVEKGAAAAVRRGRAAVIH